MEPIWEGRELNQTSFSPPAPGSTRSARADDFGRDSVALSVKGLRPGSKSPADCFGLSSLVLLWNRIGAPGLLQKDRIASHLNQ
jgi:hypothetical protein